MEPERRVHLETRRGRKVNTGLLKHVRSEKFINNGKGKIGPRTRAWSVGGRGESKSSSFVEKVAILHLRLSWGLDMRGCRLLRRGVVPWWLLGSYGTKAFLEENIKFFVILLCSRLNRTWIEAS